MIQHFKKSGKTITRKTKICSFDNSLRVDYVIDQQILIMDHFVVCNLGNLDLQTFISKFVYNRV